jgi:hypothetical protein
VSTDKCDCLYIAYQTCIHVCLYKEGTEFIHVQWNVIPQKKKNKQTKKYIQISQAMFFLPSKLSAVFLRNFKSDVFEILVC